jgi:hypothetical protein
MARLALLDMMDKTGRLQLYVRKDVLGEEPYAGC